MRTALYTHHVELDAKIVDFTGWQMPIQYKGILIEHQAVRERVGLFDVSHMGYILVEGPDAENLLEKLSLSPVASHVTYSAIYTVWCHESGGSVDDVMLFKVSQQKIFVIVNASNRQKDLLHLKKYAQDFEVTIQDFYESYGILALQGPHAVALLQEIYPHCLSLKSMHFMSFEQEGKEVLVSRTGYTGAGGFEIFLPNELLIPLWEDLLHKGKKYGIEPAGLGARDTLRLEMGFALYGHELADEISPVESVAAWTDKDKEPDYIGKSALQLLKTAEKKRYAYGVEMLDQGVIRQNYPIIKQGQEIGYVTSGSFSPTLNLSIALILVDQPLAEGEILNVRIRQKECRVQVAKIPFLRKNV